MASLFVTHSSHDRDEAERVAQRLRVEGFAALFLDFDPTDGIPAGRDWQRELYAQLRKADGVIFLASAVSVASQWCIAEISLALSLGKPVFPLRLETGVRLGLLDGVQWIDFSESERAFDRLFTGLRRAGLDPADSFAWDRTRSPYPGLESFSGDDAAVFFGRDHEIDRLLELLQPTLQRGTGRFVAVVGPSGSGKSSLVQAGLLPRLERLSSKWVVLPVLVPGQQPTRTLGYCVAAAFAARGQPRPVEDISATLRRGGVGLVDLAGELRELAGAGIRGGAVGGRINVLVVIDQAEELLTRTGVREQQAFLSLLRAALGDDSPVWVVATVRSELLSTAPERAGLAEMVDDSLVLEPLNRARLPIVIEQPAQRAGLQFAPGLVEQMVEETTGGDALPLLAFMLRELHHQAGADGIVTVAEYQELGGVIGALQRRADRLSDELNRRGRGESVLHTLIKFAVVEGDVEPTSRRIPRSALGPDEQAVADAFVEARLLTISVDAGGETVVGVAHEALLRQWRPLREAIEASRASLRMRSELERLAADWHHGRRDDSYLLRGNRLAELDQWAIAHTSELRPQERQFIEATRREIQRRAGRTRRKPVRVRPDVVSLVVDENVQFTVYRPGAVQPGVWYPMLTFAHLAERRDQVIAIAEQALGDQAPAYASPTSDARRPIPKASELTFVPDMVGVEFNPPRRVFRWLEEIHKEEFRLRADSRLNGQVSYGRLTVFMGAFILADVDLVIKIDDSAAPPPTPTILTAPPPQGRSPRLLGLLEPANGSPYRKIFLSYNHRDTEIVKQVERLGAALGHVYLRDRTTVRSGEEWNTRMLQLIDEADVFQLFWSSNSMRSEYVRQEWEHAVTLARPNFIRPTYWEEPMPRSDDPLLPPSSLSRLHFHLLVLPRHHSRPSLVALVSVLVSICILIVLLWSR